MNSYGGRKGVKPFESARQYQKPGSESTDPRTAHGRAGSHVMRGGVAIKPLVIAGAVVERCGRSANRRGLWMARHARAASAAFLTAFFLLGAGGVATAQPQPLPLPFPNLMQGTPEEEAACAPDSTRFCKRFEPDAMQVLGCLQRNRTSISKACQRVLRNRGV